MASAPNPATLPASGLPDCYALLDDSSADAYQARSRLYTAHVETLQCDDEACFPAMLERLERGLRRGLHAVGLFTYELGAAMQRIEAREETGTLAQILLFSRCERLTSQQVEQWLAQGDHASPAGIAGVRSSVDEHAFNEAIARIRAYIEAGDTYQVNYTYRIQLDAYGPPHALYRRLRARQPVPYGALIALPGGASVLSLSPELFVRHERGILTARPMKGTAPASDDPESDALRAAALAADGKNRAENLMIVDLLRNDLARIAQVGSVRVPSLFQVERYRSVLQMTSTVQAGMRSGVQLQDVFAAIYPCGSITGAPKRRTMQIIRELEPSPRGLYTGAIGWFDPCPPRREGVGLGDFCLSVPIRTLALQPEDDNGVRRGELGVGAGIVHDSIAADELKECRLKAGFLTGLPNAFSLFETMHAGRDAGIRHLDRHLRRLRSSAAYFGFVWDEREIRELLEQACAALPKGSHRLRLALERDGGCEIRTAALASLPPRVKVLLAPQPMRSTDLFLRHKTTLRTAYDAAWQAAEAKGAFDMLFFNEKGELTEGGRSNVFARIDGRWITPPLSCGLLPGVMRAVLLEELDAREQAIGLRDLERAQELIVCNALRGALTADLVRD
ncbi:chorismate-binding protein [Noviherbaspirillum sp. CPCC 100848]|uniref:Chorismate-binding protein n=1 Tax=Noviherbaspirillum album TaxID=3080276 RepID=A0ABU6JH55_9BURK|nr:chorismate-binding protein [Noviherbaspirillum sp. CPCC 100848]MEC4722620.1 chorismate-binding protein [Noviherbaspirillum sp. CPCC 100848]